VLHTASVQATAAWKALSAAGKIGEHGLSFVVNGVRITIYTQLLITYLCQASAHSAGGLAGTAHQQLAHVAAQHLHACDSSHQSGQWAVQGIPWAAK
jgi:hypothetical protein